MVYKNLLKFEMVMVLFLLPTISMAIDEAGPLGCVEESGECETPDEVVDPTYSLVYLYQSPFDYDGDKIDDDEDLCPYVHDSYFVQEEFVPEEGNEDATSDGGVGINDFQSEQVGEYDQLDADQDLVGDACDNCNFYQNPDQDDMDADGAGDMCDNDKDGDLVFEYHPSDDIDAGIEEESDAGPSEPVAEGFDNCPSLYNPAQLDVDLDGTGDVCDNDIDGDGAANLVDDCPFGEASELSAAECAGDSDDDGVFNFDITGAEVEVLDNCPTVANPDQADMDSDGIGDACDTDIDNDGVPNIRDNCYNPKEEIDPNAGTMEGWGKYEDIANEDQLDSDRDGIGDACDCNPNCFVVPSLVSEYQPDAQFVNEGCDSSGVPEEGFCAEDSVCLDPDCPFRVASPVSLSTGTYWDLQILRLFSNRQNAIIRYMWSVEEEPSGGSAVVIHNVGVVGYSTPYEYNYFRTYNDTGTFAPRFMATKEGQYTLKLMAQQVSIDPITEELDTSVQEATVVVNVFGGYTYSDDDCACATVGAKQSNTHLGVIIGLLATILCFVRIRRRFF